MASEESTTQRVARGSGIMLVARLLQRSLGLVSTLVLARLLVPADFAVVAVAILVVQLLDIVCNTGARQYIVQAEELTPHSVDTAWTLDLGFRTLAALILIALLPLVQWFWKDASITAATAWLAPTLALRALQNPELHVDVRQIRYDRLFRVDLAQKVVSTGATIACAAVFESFWAIVLGAWVSALTGLVVSHRVCAHRPRLCLKNVGAQWAFSKWMVSRAFIGYLRAQIDSFLASRLFDPSSFGQYTLARELTVLPATDVVVPLIQPLLSTFSRARAKEGALARQLCAATLFVSALIAPVCMLLHAEGDMILLLALGEGWEPAAGLVAPMVPMLFGFSLGGIINFLFLAQGKVRTLLWYDAVSLAIVASSLLAFGQTSMERYVSVRSGLAVAITVATLTWGSRQLGVPATRLLGAVALPVLIALAAGAIARWLSEHWITFDAPLANASLYGASLTVIYILAMMATGLLVQHRSESWRDVMSFVSGVLANAGARAQRIAKRR